MRIRTPSYLRVVEPWVRRPLIPVMLIAGFLIKSVDLPVDKATAIGSELRMEDSYMSGSLA
jgi:hypothetical protein